MSALAGAPPPASPQQDAATSKKRNRMLCQRCRHDKQGCTPQDRNWDQNEKCHRCETRGYECSAPEKAPFKKRKRRATLAAGLVHTSIHTSAAPNPSDATSMHHLTHTVSAPTPGNPRSRPIIAWEAEIESIQPVNPAPSNTQADIESASVSVRRSNEQEARIILAKLGDLHATREILRSDLELCDQVESWVGCSDSIRKIRNAIEAAIAAIIHDFKTSVEMVKPFGTKTKDVGPFKEAFVSQLTLVRFRFFHSPPAAESSALDEDQMLIEDGDDVQERLHELRKRKKVWSAADYLFGNARGRLSSRHAIHGQSENDVVFCYIKASESIKEVFSEILLEHLEHREIMFSGFGQASDSISALPPCHLAVYQANTSVLLSLWRTSAMPVWDVDYLRRTPVHSAAYAGKVQGLRTIWQNNPLTATNTGCDSFGMTPLAIAACKDDVKTFMRLVQALVQAGAIHQATRHNIVDDNGVMISILGLAARNGSVRVIEYILSHPFLSDFQTESSELCQALSNNQVRVAHILIDWHCKFEQYDLTNQVIVARQISIARGFQDIDARLKSLVPSREDGIQSLDTMIFDSFTNHSEIWEDQGSFDQSQFDNSQGCDFDASTWNIPDSHVSSFTSLSMSNLVVPVPTLGGSLNFPTDSSHGIHQIRHRGASRTEPP